MSVNNVKEKSCSRGTIIRAAVGTFALTNKLMVTLVDMEKGMTFEQSFYTLHGGGLAEIGAILGATILLCSIINPK